jgi:predicted SprT family Zn-dependent metalloprotease
MVDGEGGRLVEIGEARRLAHGLMRRHGLTGWRLVFDHAKTRAGICRAHPREIGLSRVLTALHSEAEVRETILHEIAHALVGPEHGHDAVWQHQARLIGCTARRCVSSDAPRPSGPWVGTCPSGHTMSRHRQPVRVQSCGECSRGFNPAFLLDWTWNGRTVAMHPRYEAERRSIVGRVAAGVGDHGPAVAARSANASRAAVNDPGTALLAVGARVRVLGKGKYAGSTGTVVTVGRSRYHVKTRRGLLTVPFALVDPG